MCAGAFFSPPSREDAGACIRSCLCFSSHQLYAGRVTSALFHPSPYASHTGEANSLFQNAQFGNDSAGKKGFFEVFINCVKGKKNSIYFASNIYVCVSCCTILLLPGRRKGKNPSLGERKFLPFH